MDLEGDFGELRLGQFSVPNEAITMREVEPILHMEEDDDFGDLRGEEVDPLHFDMDQPVTEVPGEEALVDDLTGALAEVPVEVSSGPMITDEPAEAPGAPQRNGGADIGPPHHTPLPQEEQPQGEDRLRHRNETSTNVFNFQLPPTLRHSHFQLSRATSQTKVTLLSLLLLNQCLYAEGLAGEGGSAGEWTQPLWCCLRKR